MSLVEWALTAALGALLFLDAWPVAQTMLSRPIVAGPLAGLVLGAPGEGVIWGAVFEAVYLGVLPIGASRYPDAGLAALVATVVAVQGGGAEAAGYLVTVAVLAGMGGERATVLHRRWNGRAASRVRHRVEAGDLRAPGRAVAGAVGRGALVGATVSLVAVGLALAGLAVVEGSVWSGAMPEPWVRLAALAAVAVGGARLFLGRRSGRLAWAAGLVGAAGLVWWVAGASPS